MEQRSIPFLDPGAGEQHMRRVMSGLSPALAKAVPALLADLPDPDSAVILLGRFLDECPESVHAFEQRNFLLHYAIVIFGHSRYLAETLIQNPDLLQAFAREKNLDRSFSREEFEEDLARLRSRSFETDISRILARFKRREYVRIMLRDVLKLAPLAETTAEISALTDVLIENALSEAANRMQKLYGLPRNMDSTGRIVDTPFAVLSFGKLGGNELNYNSDVDLFYIFGDGEAPPDATITNHEYFVRLAQEATQILSCITPEGPVFRIDLRLRPQGNEGELAISMRHALRYYAASAHDWEKQALIKLRHSAGNTALARAFIRRVQPHVYQMDKQRGNTDGGTDLPRGKGAEQKAERTASGLNFSALKTVLDAREKMAEWKKRNPLLQREEEPGIDIKLGRGGIRDVEFLVQCLQRVYGGVEPWLRSRGTLFALQKLHDKNHISGHEFHELTGAYEFLRHLEHRLQLEHGRQTHWMPVSEPGVRILQRAMEGYAPGEDRGTDLAELVHRKMGAVAEIYQRIMDQQSVRSRIEDADTEFQLSGPAAANGGEQSNREILERLAADAPALYNVISEAPPDAPARRNLFRFLSSAFTSSERYAAVIRYPQAAKRALALFEGSEFLTEMLVRYPDEIAILAEPEENARPLLHASLFGNVMRESRAAADPIFDYLAKADLPYVEKVSLLRRHFRRRVLLSGARDILELRGIYESLAETTAAADDAIQAAFRIAGAPDDLAVMAVGRLGSREFDVLSDADLLFVCADGGDAATLSRFAGQFMQVLAAYTRDGTLFPVDTRLRPHGAEGELVVPTSQLKTYFLHEAQAWEALMYTKLRFVAGSRQLGEETLLAVDGLLARYAKDSRFLPAVLEMRDKLESLEPEAPNLKTGRGGSYDVDFFTSFLLIQSGTRQRQGNLRDRLWRCVEVGLLEKSAASELDHGAEFLRTVEHVVRLVSGRAYKWLPPTEHAKEVIVKLTSRIFGRKFEEGLEVELERVQAKNRALYNSLKTNFSVN